MQLKQFLLFHSVLFTSGAKQLIADKLRRLDPEGLSLDELDKTEAILLTPEESASFASYLQKGTEIK